MAALYSNKIILYLGEKTVLIYNGSDFNKHKEYIIDERYNGKTIKEYLRYELLLSRRIVTRLKGEEDGIMLNSEKVTVRAVLSTGDVLSLGIFDADDNGNIVPVDMDISILFEDDDIMAVNKPYGVPTHPSHNHYTDSLANGIAYYFQKKGIPFVFRSVNRLDRDTSGIVIVAKNQMAAQRLSKELICGNVHKCYTAIVTGVTEENGIINAPIRRREESIIERIVCSEEEGGQHAVTEYCKVASKNGMSLLKVYPKTGRTHQIRVHMAYIGHPILGDTLYGKADAGNGIDRQALHCSSMSFKHPMTGELITITADLFDDMKNIAEEIIAPESVMMG